MKRRVFVALALVVLLSLPAVAQMPEGYLDLFIVKVKPEKRAEFDAISKKVAEANRRNKGDAWLAYETVYGEGNTVSFVSLRSSYAETEKATEIFMGALHKAFGEAGTEKIFKDFNNCLVSSHGEVRRRRWDLSYNPPADPAANAKMVGESRWLRTIIVHVRPGQGPNFEALIRDVKAAAQRTNQPYASLVSQSASGQEGTVYYITRLLKSLGDLDNAPPLPQMMGEEGYQKFLKGAAESELRVDTVINHFLPELSNPPEEVASVAASFWRPKPKAAAKPKPKAAEAGEAEAKDQR